MEIDLRKIHDELTIAFIKLEYDRENPSAYFNNSDKTFIEPWIIKYNSDSIFHNKIDFLISGIMRIVTDNIK